MAEQLEIPAGEPETAAPNPQGIPTFGDLPEGGSARGIPRITFADEPEPVSASSDEPTTPGPATAGPAASAAELASAQPVAGAPNGPGAAQDLSLFHSMVAFDQYKKAEEEQKKQQAASQNWQPPAIPDEVSEEVLSDPKKFSRFASEITKWNREATVNAVQPVAQKLAATESALNTLLYRQHQSAWQDVRDSLQAKGVNADAYYGALETALQNNPATYWNIKTDPQAMLTAVEFIHSRNGGTFTGTPEAPKEPMSAGTSSAPPARTESASNYDHPAIQQAEKTLGIKFNKKMREAFKRGEGRVEL